MEDVEIDTHRWFIVPENRSELLATTKDLIVEIRELADEQANLQRLKGNEEMTEKLDEVLQEIHSQFDKIAATLQSSTMVFTHLKSLCENVQKIHEFFGVLKTTKMFIFRKTKLRKEMTLLYNNIRHSCTQLMASVSLELLGYSGSPDTKNSPIVDDIGNTPESINSELRRGHKYFYGINRSPNYSLAFQSYKLSADRGNLDGIAMLAHCYYHGYGTDKDEDLAIEWLEKTLDSNHALGKYLLGVILLNQLMSRVPMTATGDLIEDADSKEEEESTERDDVMRGGLKDNVPGISGDFEDVFQRVVRLFSDSAEQGHTDAQTALGQLFELAGDYETALKWYEVATSRGCLRAQNLLGMMYFDGNGVPKLREKAFSMFQEAGRGGDACAMNNVAMCLELGQGVEQNIDAALQIYKEAADNGSAQAAYSYGYLLVQHAMRTIVGCKINPKSSLIYTGRASEHLQTHEREKKLQIGIYYLRVALEKGVAQAGFQLARLYEQGIGVPMDRSSSYSNFLWASRLGHAKSAMCAANMLYESCMMATARPHRDTTHDAPPAITDINFVAATNTISSERIISHNLMFAANLYLQAARGGIVEAMNAYGVMLEDGTVHGSKGKNTSPQKAATWYHAAAEGGLLEAIGNLAMLLRNYEDIEQITTVDGRECHRSDLLLWINTITSSPFVRTGDVSNISDSKLSVGSSGRMAKSNLIGSNESKTIPEKSILSVAILPRLRAIDFGSEVEKGHIFRKWSDWPIESHDSNAWDPNIKVRVAESLVGEDTFSLSEKKREDNRRDEIYSKQTALSSAVSLLPNYDVQSKGRGEKISNYSGRNSSSSTSISKLKNKKTEYSLDF